MKKIILSAIMLSLVSSCATVESGRTQKIKVTSTPTGADCTLSNGVSTVTVKTPGVAEVGRSMSSLKVQCVIGNEGNGEGKLNYNVNWWAAANVLNLGIGYFYDTYTGSVAQYPPEINVVLKPMARTYEGNFQMRDSGNSIIPMGTPQMQNQTIPQIPGIPQVPSNPGLGNSGPINPGYGTIPNSMQQPGQPQVMAPAPGNPLTPEQRMMMQQQMMQNPSMQPQTQAPAQPQSQEQIMQEMMREHQQLNSEDNK